MMNIPVNKEQKFSFQLDEFYLDLQEDGSRISLLNDDEIVKTPFPGLRPFKTSEFQLFKGRVGQAEELISRLKKYHFLAVIGSSGTGKTSLVRAGLIPQLFGGYLYEAGNNWNIAICRPGKNPIENLSIALAGIKCHSKQKDKIVNEYGVIEQLLNNSAYGILEVNELLNSGRAKEDHGNLLVIIDQFEELFRFDRKDLGKENIENQFVNLLLKASLNPASSVYVIVTMRSEFLGDCVKYRGLPEAINEGQYLVPQLNRNQLKEVIEAPIHLAGKKIFPGLVELLVNEIEESKLKENLDQLPILQHALMRTYNEAMKDGPDTEINYEHYRSIGGMEKALANHAEAKYKELADNNRNDEFPSKRQRIAKIIFQALTDLSADQKGGRRPTDLKTLYAIAASIHASQEEVDEVINHFRENETSFIMPPITTPLYSNLILDISHESLMRNWVRLNEWINEEVHFGKLYKTLNERRELSEQDETESIRGILLKELMEWKLNYPNNSAWASRYHQLINRIDTVALYDDAYKRNLQFLEKSNSESELRKEKEKKILEEEIKRSQRDKSRKQMNRFFGVAAFIAVMLAIWGFIERNKAELESNKVKLESNKLKVKTIEAQQQRNLADSSSKEAKKEKESAEKQKELADASKIKAEMQEMKALAYAEQLETQRNLASLRSDSLQIKTDSLMVLTFENSLTKKDWWYMDLLNEKLKNYIKNTLFKLYYHPDDRQPNHQDSLLAMKLENSLELLYDANRRKDEDWGLFLQLVKETNSNHRNYVTEYILDSLIKNSLRFEKKFTLPYSSTFGESNYDVRALSFLLKSTDEFVAGRGSSFYFYNKDDSVKLLLRMEPGNIAFSISDDASRLLGYNKNSREFILYKSNGRVYEKDGHISFKNDIKDLNTKKATTPVSVSKVIPGNDTASAVDTAWPDDWSTYDTKSVGVNVKAIFSPDNNFLAAYDGVSNYVIKYNLINKTFDSISTRGDKQVKDLLFNHSGSKLLICFADSAILIDNSSLMQVRLKRSKFLGNSSATFNKAAFSNNDSLISIISGPNYNAKKLEWKEDGTFMQTVPIPASFLDIIMAPVNEYSFTLDEKSSYGPKSLINLLDKDFKISKVFPFHNSDIKSIDVSADGKWVISEDMKAIYLWNISHPLKVEEIESLNKNTIAAYYKDKGDIHYRSKRYDTAIIYYNQVIALNPNDGSYLSALADTYFVTGRYDSAIRFYSKAIKADSTKLIYHYNLGSAYEYQKKYHPAISAYYNALEIDSTDSWTWNALGNTYFESEKYDSAIYGYQKAIAFDPGYGRYHAHLANVYYQVKKYDTAMVLLKNALKLDPKYAWAWNMLGNTYYSTGNYSSAVESFQKAIEYETNMIYYVNLGDAYSQLNQYDFAISALNNALVIDPTYAGDWNKLGGFYLRIKNYPLAIEAHKEASRLNSKNAYYLKDLGYAYYWARKYDSAITVLRKAIKIDPTLAESWNNLAYVFQDLKKYDSALVFFNKAKSLMKGNQFMWSNLAQLYVQMNNYREAIRYADSAIANNPNDSRAYAHKGFAYLGTGKIEQGIEHLRTAISLDTSDYKSYYYLACYYALSNNTTESIGNLEIAIQKGFDDIERLKGEACFFNLRNDRRYKDLLALLQEKVRNQ